MSDNGANSGEIAIIIFGVTGDLSCRKLMPALYDLAADDRLPAPLTVIGFARRDWDDAVLRENLRQGVDEFARIKPIREDILNPLLESMRYIRSTFKDLEGYGRLHQLLDDLGICNRLFYLATPPEAYTDIIRNIGQVQLQNCPGGWTHIIIEKPYGHDLSSAMELDHVVHQVFDESQVYRIDHYLGKETVQNILVFRFANGIFEPLWNRKYIDHVEVTVAEEVGVGSRAGYYEGAGVIRDMFQNHILQLLTLTAMEAPVAFNADTVRDEKLKVLRAIRPMEGKDAIANTFRAQYVSGWINGKRVPGYKDEPGVAKDSKTETLMAAHLYVDNWRWAGVPFCVRSGKRLPLRMTEVAIQFKQVPLSLFHWRNMAGDAPNRLIIKIQPDEGIDLTFGAKVPGPINQIAPVEMEFDYTKTFGGEPPEAYERLLLDCMVGDATLFTRSDEVQAAWSLTTEILKSWESHPIQNLPVYEAGTWGPPGINAFMEEHGRTWHNRDLVLVKG